MQTTLETNKRSWWTFEAAQWCHANKLDAKEATMKEKLALHASCSKGDACGEFRFPLEPTYVARH